MREHEYAIARERLGLLLKKINTSWEEKAASLQNDAQRFESDGPTEQVKRELHADQVKQGLSQFNDLFEQALSDLKNEDAQRMVNLFTLAVESCFVQNFLDGDALDQKRAGELMALEYTFYGFTEEDLREWQTILGEHMIIDPHQDLVGNYKVRNHEEEY